VPDADPPLHQHAPPQIITHFRNRTLAPSAMVGGVAVKATLAFSMHARAASLPGGSSGLPGSAYADEVPKSASAAVSRETARNPVNIGAIMRLDRHAVSEAVHIGGRQPGSIEDLLQEFMGHLVNKGGQQCQARSLLKLS
jgi:hypothetical protein